MGVLIHPRQQLWSAMVADAVLPAYIITFIYSTLLSLLSSSISFTPALIYPQVDVEALSP